MTVTLFSGSYPQISGMYTQLNSLIWDEETLKQHGHKILELRIKELTLSSMGSSKPIYKVDDNSLTGLSDIRSAIASSKFRTSHQVKATLIVDMYYTTINKLESAIRSEINNRGYRNGETIDIIIETMITECRGHKCHWARIDKGVKEGTKMILVYVDGKHVGKMTALNRAATMDFTWDEEACDLTAVDIAVIKKGFACPLSGEQVRQ